MDINSYHCKQQLNTNELISLEKLSTSDIFEILSCSNELKTRLKFGEKLVKNIGKNILFMSKTAFAKSRIAFEIAVNSLNANSIAIPLGGSHLEELMESDETIKIIERLGVSTIVMDTSEQSDSIKLSKCLKLPIINACEQAGACQALAVLATVWENKHKLDGLKATIIGNLDNGKASLLYGFAKCGIDTMIIAPEQTEEITKAMEYASQFSDVTFSNNISAIKGSDIVFSFEHEFGDKYKLFNENFQRLCKNACFMQNVPLQSEKQADSELIKSENSLVLELGENLMHITRTAIYLLS